MNCIFFNAKIEYVYYEEVISLTKDEKLKEKLLKQQEKIQKKLDKIDSHLNNEKEKREYLQYNSVRIQQHREYRAEIHRRNAPPYRSGLEEIGNAVTHGVGAILATIGLILMLLKADNFRANFGAMIYGISMIFMMLMSCIYHALPRRSMGKHVLRRFDYTSIYLLIGGTFTPIFLLFFYKYLSTLAIVLCALQWAIIIAGITNVCIFGPGRHKIINFGLYIILGWCGLMFIPYLVKHNMTLFWYILSGGIVYTIGIIPFVMKNKAAHFIWHFFVLGGAILQFIGIYLTLYC